MTIKEEDYDGKKSYVCTRCRGMFQTFDKKEADDHEKAGDHPYAKDAVEDQAMNPGDQRAAVFGVDDLPREAVDVPWDLGGAKLYVRGLTASEKDAWYARNMPGGEFRWTPSLTADLLVKTLCTEDGDRLFTDSDAEALGAKSAVVLSELMTVAMRLSGLSEETEVAVEEGFTDAQGAASSSV